MTADAHVELRPATAADDHFLRDLYATTRARELAATGLTPEQVEGFVNMQWRAQALDYTARFPAARHDMVVADGIDVGRFWVDHRPQHILVLDIALRPEWCGRGIGTILFTNLQATAAATESAIGHSVAKDNTQAIRFYRRLGFDVVDELDFHHVMKWSAGPG